MRCVSQFWKRGPPLAKSALGVTQAAIGWRYAAEAPVRVSLMWMHPGSSSSVEFLFGARGDQKRYKRKRGERHPDVHSQFAPIGASAFNILFQCSLHLSVCRVASAAESQA